MEKFFAFSFVVWKIVTTFVTINIINLIFGIMKITVQMAIMSHLSDAQELSRYIHVEKRGQIRDEIDFVKQLLVTFPDTSVEVEEEELNELWRKVIE